MFTVRCRGKIETFTEPVVMGILNITPDSFYDGAGRMLSLDAYRTKAALMLEQGARILDIGAQSTRPGSTRVSADEEWSRLSPVLQEIRSAFPDALISVDTYHASVASMAVAMGADMINDISFGLMDNHMLETVAHASVPYIGMHMQGTPETMQAQPHYTNVVTEVLDFLVNRMHKAREAGIKDIILDPGFGFGKTLVHNFELLHALRAFKITQCPLLVGISRKGMVYKTLGITADESLNGTSILNTLALTGGASILRVHDVKEAMECIRLTNAYKKAAS